MSVKVTSWAWEHSRSSGTPRLVLLALADEANDQGLVTAHRRSQAHLARKCAIDPQTVRRAIRTLTALGEVEVLVQGDGRQQSDYRVRTEGDQSDTPGVAPVPPQGAQSDTPGVSPVTPPSSRSYPASNPVGSKTSLSANADVGAVFDAWRISTNHLQARLDSKRERVIRARLRDFPVEDLVDAVQGWRLSPHHRGENDRGTVYNELTTLLRDAAQVEKFRDLARDGPTPPPLRLSANLQTVDQVFAQLEQEERNGQRASPISDPPPRGELPSIPDR